jgi:hypothetical protein
MGRTDVRSIAVPRDDRRGWISSALAGGPGHGVRHVAREAKAHAERRRYRWYGALPWSSRSADRAATFRRHLGRPVEPAESRNAEASASDVS